MSIIGSNNADIESRIKDWFEKCVITDVQPNVQNKEEKHPYIDVEGNVKIEFCQDTALPPFIKFGHIHGNFECLYSKFQSMTGFPKYVDKDFTCFSCPNIYSIEGMPTLIERDCIIRKCGRQFTEEEIRDKSNVTRKVYCE